MLNFVEEEISYINFENESPEKETSENKEPDLNTVLEEPIKDVTLDELTTSYLHGKAYIPSPVTEKNKLSAEPMQRTQLVGTEPMQRSQRKRSVSNELMRLSMMAPVYSQVSPYQISKISKVVPDIEEKIKSTLVDFYEYNNQQYSLADFQELRKLGSGSFGTTYAVKNLKLGKLMVIKVIPKDKEDARDVSREVEVLTRLAKYCEMYIICYIGYFEDQSNYYILTEFLASYITLDQYLNEYSYTMPELLDLTTKLINGLRTIHQCDVAHHDIKPENIMINPSNKDIKYIDFGISCYDNCKMVSIKSGTIIYMPPESFKPNQPNDLELFQLGDIWSLGITIYKLITGYTILSNYIRKVNPNMKLSRAISDLYGMGQGTIDDIIDDAIPDMGSPLNITLKNMLKISPYERRMIIP